MKNPKIRQAPNLEELRKELNKKGVLTSNHLSVQETKDFHARVRKGIKEDLERMHKR